MQHFFPSFLFCFYHRVLSFCPLKTILSQGYIEQCFQFFFDKTKTCVNMAFQPKNVKKKKNNNNSSSDRNSGRRSFPNRRLNILCALVLHKMWIQCAHTHTFHINYTKSDTYRKTCDAMRCDDGIQHFHLCEWVTWRQPAIWSLNWTAATVHTTVLHQ